jgi:hypothetical protein
MYLGNVILVHAKSGRMGSGTKRTLIAGPRIFALCQERISIYVGARHALRVRHDVIQAIFGIMVQNLCRRYPAA